MRVCLLAVLVVAPGCREDAGAILKWWGAAGCPRGQACRDGRGRGCSRDAACQMPATCGGGGGQSQCGCPDKDGDQHRCDDCDDDDALVFTGAPEICDNQDNDCDGESD